MTARKLDNVSTQRYNYSAVAIVISYTPQSVDLMRQPIGLDTLDISITVQDTIADRVP